SRARFAVWIDRVSSDVYRTSGRAPASASSCPAAAASLVPVGDSGTSTQPVNSPSAFQVLSPWRSRITVPMAPEPSGAGAQAGTGTGAARERTGGAEASSGNRTAGPGVPPPEVYARAATFAPAGRNDQPSHVAARAARDGRRGRAERVCRRGGQKAGRARHRGGHLHPRGVQGR